MLNIFKTALTLGILLTIFAGNGFTQYRSNIVMTSQNKSLSSSNRYPSQTFDNPTKRNSKYSKADLKSNLANNKSVITENATTGELEVLYDQLGGSGNWCFDETQGVSGFYDDWYDNFEENTFKTSTVFIGSLTQSRILRRLEVVMDAYNGVTGEEVSLTSFNEYKIRIWNQNIYGYQDNAGVGSMSNTMVDAPNFGNMSVPVGFKTLGSGESIPVYHIGWDNLNIILPANIPLQVSVAPATPIILEVNFMEVFLVGELT